MVQAPAPAASVFDVGPFWLELEKMMRFVRDRLKFGQTDVEEVKMDEHLRTAYTTLRTEVIKDEKQASVPSRLFFWDSCKKALEPVFDHKAKEPKGSVNFEEFYRCLYKLQLLVFDKPTDFWRSEVKPVKPPFSEAPPARMRSRSPRRAPLKGKGSGKGRGKGKGTSTPPQNVDPKMGRQGIWLWRNPPRPLYEGAGFWIFLKQAYWVCETPKDQKDFDKFVPTFKHTDGNLTMWIREKYATQFPFLDRYDTRQGLQYGLLNRLDRETSGPVVVVKDEDSFKKLKRTRDCHDWHKEYVCLVHGKIPKERWQGVLEDWMHVSEQGSSATTKVVDRWVANGPGEKCNWATTLYQVQDYYVRTDKTDSEPRHYTLVKVRIITGMRHQIRVHMSHLLRGLGKQIGEGEDFGLCSDFLYLRKSVSKEDQEKVCERVFLHERMLGMWDPEDNSRTVCAKAPLPQELEEALSRLQRDEEALAELKQYQAQRAKDYFIDAFCQKYKIGPREWKELHESEFWANRKEQLKKVLRAFEERAGDGLPSLSMDGDHSFLFEGIRKAVENVGASEWGVEDALRRHIDDRLWEQQWQEQRQQVQEASTAESLPPGWRRMENGTDGEVFYLHESGQRDRRRPVPDPDLLPGWVKLACQSRPGEFIYFNFHERRTLLSRPTAQDILPPGWKCQKSTQEPGAVFYIHTATGRRQKGIPCEGSLEDLPPDWEKVASSRPGGDPYYFNRATGATQLDKPEALPPGWERIISTRGRTFYWNEQLQRSQFEKPRQALPKPDGSVVPLTPPLDEDGGMSD